MVRDFFDEPRPFEPPSLYEDNNGNNNALNINRSVRFSDAEPYVSPLPPPPLLPQKKSLNGKSRVVVSQPTSEAWDYEFQWHAGLSQCCQDLGQCCYAWFCLCCILGQLHMRTGDCVFMFCVPGSLWAMRQKIRTSFRIRGSLCRDCMATCCCPSCVAIQLSKELSMQAL